MPDSDAEEPAVVLSHREVHLRAEALLNFQADMDRLAGAMCEW